MTKSVNQIASTQGKLDNAKRGIENAILKAQKSKFALEDLQKKLKVVIYVDGRDVARIQLSKPMNGVHVWM